MLQIRLNTTNRLRLNTSVSFAIFCSKSSSSFRVRSRDSRFNFFLNRGASRKQIPISDSAKFDPTPYESKMDLVFVDGAHSADYVRNDSEKGWRMLRPGGVLVWHDFVKRSVLNGG